MNLSVQTPDEWLGAVSRPQSQRIEQFTIKSADWLVVCAGFEDRALAVLENASTNARRFNLLVVCYEPVFPENKLEKIREIATRVGLNTSEITYDRQEPSGFGAKFLQRLAGCGGEIFIDVSAMSRLLIVQVLVALGTREAGLSKCSVAYAEALDYPPTQAEAEAELQRARADPSCSILFLSSGVFEVSVIPELSSVAPAGTQTRLIAFPSLDAHQLIALRNEIEPSRFSFIEGVPPSHQNRWRERVVSIINHLDKSPNAERFRTGTLDYRETLDLLVKLYAAHGERERLLISPTGSKMQAVAVGIFRAIVEDVQIVYPTPRSFLKPDGYTIGVGPLHLLSLDPFGKRPLAEATG